MSRAINILHLSDLHFSRKHKHNVEIIMDALLPDLIRLSDSSLKPDLVIFSGDVVQAADDQDIYLYFNDAILEPIAKATGCSLGRFILTPGNHDVQRTTVAKNVDLMKKIITDRNSRDSLNEAYIAGSLEQVAKENFESYLKYIDYFDVRDGSTGNDFFQVHHFKELNLDVAVANTAWMSFGGFGDRQDLRQLLYPEAAISEAIHCLDKKHTSLLVTHHPLNWLTEWSEADFVAVSANRFKAHFFGHMHDAQPTSTISLHGECLQNQAGALYSGRQRYIGYSLTRYDQVSGNIAVHLNTYSDQRRQFHPAEQLIENGIFYPSLSAAHFWKANNPVLSRTEIAEWVKTVLLPKTERELNEGLTDRKLCDVFVSPPLSMQTEYSKGPGDDDLPERKEIELAFDRFVFSSENFMIFGNSEYGKTTLLKQAALRMLQAENVASITVPIIVEFGQISSGRDKILRLLKASIAEESEGWTLRQLLSEGLVTIMVDDAVLSDRERMDVLRNFASDFPRNRFIFTSTTRETLPSQAVADPNLSIKMQPLFIKAMTRSAMRSLVTKWDNQDRLNRDDILKRLLNEMKSINVPITAVNGTILLTIYESHTNFKPINRAVLIENFIEALLDKSAPSSIERRTFDFTNQKHLLSHISKWMAQGDNYVVDVTTLRSVVQEYLDNRGLLNDASKIVNDFIQARIFSSRSSGQISFRYRAFSEYFTANQMLIDKSFYDWVTDESRYLSFTNEIIYYAGIHRADLSLLNVIGDRFSQIRSEVFFELRWNPDLKSLEKFRFPEDGSDSKEMLEDFERQFGASPLTAEEQDDLLEAEMPRDVESRQEVFRPKAQDPGQKMFLGLLLYSGLIKNLELISDLDKRRHLNLVLDAWGVFLMASLQLVPQLSKRRRMKVNGVIYEVQVPPKYNDNQAARFIYLGMPTGLATLIWHALGSEKLELQLSQLTLDEQNQNGIVSFFRNSLCADLQIGDWWKSMADYAKYFRDSPYMTQVLLWKMRDLHVMGSVPKRGVSDFRNTLADLFATLSGGDHKNRLRARSQHMMKLKREDALRRLRITSSE